MESLNKSELVSLVKSVFPPLAQDRVLAILVDIPLNENDDNENWRIRRQLAQQWAHDLQASGLGLERVHLIAYTSVGSNNADLPAVGTIIEKYLPTSKLDLEQAGTVKPFTEIFQTTQLFLAPTEYSTTAPLKMAAKKYGFRAATMPGFCPEMIPALRIDYGAVNERVQFLKKKLDAASSADVRFLVDKDEAFHVYFDLRYRPAHASGGRFPEPGVAGNVPSGETYIVPYEGEKGEPSQTNGVLPVQFGDEIVLFEIKENRAVKVMSSGKTSREQAEYLHSEPAYGNMAELGFGVLADFGLKPIGEILLDEKLGFHIAFGRSEHFGGAVGPKQFSSPAAVVHIDRIYIPETQPRIRVQSIGLSYNEREKETIMKDGKYLLWS